MLIYLCLSSHGYGHAARQAAIFAEINRLKPDWRLVVSSKVDENFLRLAFQGLNIEYRSFQWDVGVVQHNAFEIDLHSTLISLKKLEYDLPNQIQNEADWIKDQEDQILIIGDIPPAAADLASKVNCPLVWIGNFGWDDILSIYGEEFDRYTKSAANKYASGNYLLRCPFSLDMNWGLSQKEIGLTSAQARPIEGNFMDKLEKIVFHKSIIMVIP